jgi:hypothetical protein
MMPGESLYVYQRVFTSPGVTFQQDIYQHLGNVMPEADQTGNVELKYIVAQAVYISGIQVSLSGAMSLSVLPFLILTCRCRSVTPRMVIWHRSTV